MWCGIVVLEFKKIQVVEIIIRNWLNPRAPQTSCSFWDGPVFLHDDDELMLGARQVSERLANVNTVLVDVALRILWVLELNLHLCLDTHWNPSLMATSML